MIKFITFRILRWRLKNTLPKIGKVFYKNLFSLTYKFFLILKPSQVWIIILALLNNTDIKNLIKIPSMFILFSSLFSDDESFNSKLDKNILYAKLEANKFTDSDNKWESFFWILIILALFTRFIKGLFKILWIPFKIALIYYTLRYFGYDFSYIFNILNNLSLGVIDWFYNKIIKFFYFFNNRNDKNN